MASKRAAFLEELNMGIDNIVQVVHDIYADNTEALDKATSDVAEDITRGRNFSEIVFDDLLVAFEASLAATKVEDLPYRAYSALYCARYGYSPECEREAESRLHKISFGKRIDYTDRYGSSFEVLSEIAATHPEIVISIGDDVYGELSELTARIALNDEQLNSAYNQEAIYDYAYDKIDELVQSVRSNLPAVIEENEYGGMLQNKYFRELNDIVGDFLDQAAFLNQKEDIQRLIYRVDAESRKGRSFYDMVLDDAMDLMRNSLAYSRVGDKPLLAYRRLFFARWGDDAQIMWKHAEEEVRQMIRGDIAKEFDNKTHGISYSVMKILLQDPNTAAIEKKKTGIAFISEMWKPLRAHLEKIGYNPHMHMVSDVSDSAQSKLMAMNNELATIYNAMPDEDAAGSKLSDKDMQKYAARLKIYQPEDVGDWRERLNGFVGLVEVKEALKRFEVSLENQQLEEFFSYSPTKEAEAGYNNMVFVGNPGLGKTEIARIVGALGKDSGLLPKGHIVVAGSKDLEGQYVGETKVKTTAAIEAARGGVLLIDEAYSLKPDKPGFGWGQEAMDTIVEMAPDLRKDTIIIFAGYPEETKALLETNPGANRRFPSNNHVQFKDLTGAELAEVAKRQIHARQLAISDSALNELEVLIADVKKSAGKTFGNAGTAIEFAIELARIKATEAKETGVTDQLREIQARGVKAVPEDLYIKWRLVSADNVGKLRERVLTEQSEKNERITPGFHRVADMPKPAATPMATPPQRERIAAVAQAENKIA